MPKEKRSMRDQLKGRTHDQHSEKDSGGFGQGVFDLSDVESEDLFFKPEVGENLIDIIPYEIKSDNHPKLSKGEFDYLLDVWIHKRIGPGEDSFVCLKKTFKKACPICEEAAQLAADGADEDAIDALKAKHRVFYNVINVNAKKPKIQIFEQSHFKFEKELLEEAESTDGELIVFSDPLDGYSVSFKGRKASFKGRDFIEIKKISLEERDDQYDEDIVDEAYSLDSLLIVPSYDEVRDALYGTGEPSSPKKSKDKEEDDDEESPRKGKASQPDDEDDEPKKGKKKTVKKDDEEDDEPKKGKKKKGQECPHGHEFGKECDDHKECKKCDCWDECSDAFEENKDD